MNNVRNKIGITKITNRTVPTVESGQSKVYSWSRVCPGEDQHTRQEIIFLGSYSKGGCGCLSPPFAGVQTHFLIYLANLKEIDT